MPRRHGTLERQSTQSALSIQLGAFDTAFSTSKKQRPLRFARLCRLRDSANMDAKPLCFRFGIAICAIVLLFF